MDNERLDLQSPDLVNENVEKLAALFPNCVTESAEGKSIDFDLLKQELSHQIVEGAKERYRLEWPGKREAIVTANLPTTKTLRPVREDSVDFDNTENLYIEGDNLEVLKLLQESYLGKVKMIYIDPPYNTGKDFVYKDNFTQDSEEYKEESGQKDEYNQRLVVNPDTAGRYHSNWLTMMYPRLKLARNLLMNEGVIFISIDRHEYHNLRRICDEVFGDGNFISDIVWKKKTGAGKSIKHVFDEHEYILAYARSMDFAERWRVESEGDGNFTNPDSDNRGNWESCAFTAPSKNRNPNQLYMIEVHLNQANKKVTTIEPARVTHDEFAYKKHHIKLREVLPSDSSTLAEQIGSKGVVRFIRRWAYALDNVKAIFDDNRVYINGSNIPRYKKFEHEYDGKALKSIYYDSFSTQQGTEALRNLLGESYVEYPKSIKLLKHLQQVILNDNDIVLDFFSGSASTAHAVMDFNAEDGGVRRHIQVQIPEATDVNGDAFKAGYKNICEIGKERIRRAADKIRNDLKFKIESNQDKIKAFRKAIAEGKVTSIETVKDQISESELIIADLNKKLEKVDFGFRVYRLAESNMQDVYYKPQDYKQSNLDLFADNVKPDRTPDDLLAQVMLDWGLPLSYRIEQMKVSGKQVFKVAENSLYACFEEGIDEAFAKAIAKDKPLRVVFRDRGFKDDTAKVNVRQLLKQLSPETEMKVI